MSWSFSRNKLLPAAMIAASDEYFNQPFFETLRQPERDIAKGVQIQITKAATAMPEGYTMTVTAYGSCSWSDALPNNSRNSLHTEIVCDAVEKPADAPQDGSASEPGPQAVEGPDDRTDGIS